MEKSDDKLSDRETQRRMEDAIRRAQQMPRQPHGQKPTGKGRKSPKRKTKKT
jgi:hypothetical protein